jgi:tRNA(fMet)-specific endonuclease VapC
VIHLDSAFLIDLARELGRERPGPAFDFIESLDPDEILGVSVHVVCELRAGAELARNPLREHEKLDELCAGLLVTYPDDHYALTFARVAAAISRSGKPVPVMDVLIATAALQDNAPLVTRNVKDFSRIPGLRVLKY